MRRNAEVWLRIGEQSARPGEDLYDGRLGRLTVPTLFVHGRQDPRTEPDELDSVRKVFPQSKMRIIEDGRHSPHSQADAFQEFNLHVEEFLSSG